MAGQRILMGVIGRPHGVRGLVRVQSYAAVPADLAAYGRLLDEKGRAWTLSWRGEGIAEVRDEAGRPLADRTAAERMTNVKLYVERDRLPEPEEDDFYLSDLVGLAAFGPGGEALGRVVTVHDYGAGASLEIAGAGAPLLVPFKRTCVPDVDITAGRVTVCPPEEVELGPPGEGSRNPHPNPLPEGEGVSGGVR